MSFRDLREYWHRKTPGTDDYHSDKGINSRSQSNSRSQDLSSDNDCGSASRPTTSSPRLAAPTITLFMTAFPKFPNKSQRVTLLKAGTKQCQRRSALHQRISPESAT